MALGSCSEHKEGIMVLLVKGGERLIMRPCNLAHSSHAFEDFCRAGAGKTPDQGARVELLPAPAPFPARRTADTLHPSTQAAPNSDSRRECWVQPLFLLLFGFFFFFVCLG